MTILPSTIPVIIVTFRNSVDACRCLHALSRGALTPRVEVFICENGGSDSFDHLVASLIGPDGPCIPGDSLSAVGGSRFVRSMSLRLPVSSASSPAITVHVGEAVDNLGYAGGVNAWLAPLLAKPGWPGVWILNPDTEPAPDALSELVEYAARHGRGMVGSRLCPILDPAIVHSRGLAWRKWRASTASIDLRTPAAFCPKPDDVDRRLDAPSGASIYATRACIDHIGLMDERYFLYFEDLDWGFRARQCGGVGYAHRSIVMHEGGTTIGTSVFRQNQSPLAVYLDFRNRILFVRAHFTPWLLWTFIVEVTEVVEYARARTFRNMRAAVRGMFAGLLGETGRPDNVLRAHLAAVRSDAP